MADYDEPMLLADLPAAPAPTAASPYRVLARKYRPRTFSELIGQDAMVRTLSNAIARERIPHALIMTGVRGVGKTSTARLVAKALNCVGPDGTSGPTIDPCGACEPCKAIAEGRHIDVVEMDAASHTGVDDVREIIEAVRYAAVSARYKIYIIDEVHMLSRNAFNALLKTLEEPPAHAKFLFATTEINKVPVTVLSRCMRFDLKRIPAELLTRHFAEVAAQEGVEVEPEALGLIARAAEGSARDGLSILDTAIAHAAGAVTAGQVREMLGLSDRGVTRDLLGRILSGDDTGALGGIRDQYELGVEPHALIRGLMEAVHGITRAKLGAAPDPSQSAEEREAYEDLAAKLGHPQLHRLWQLLARGLAEVAASPMPLEAAEMALLRVVHAGQLPDPGELARKLLNGEVSTPAQPVVPAKAGTPTGEARAAFPADMAALVAALEQAGHHRVAHLLHECVGATRYAPPDLALRPLAQAKLPPDFVRDLSSALAALSGVKWRVLLSDDEGEAAPSLRQQELVREAAERETVMADPTVRALTDAFPGAELLGYTLPQQREARP